MKIKAYLVGGAVRDKLRGLSPPKDLDYAVEAPDYESMVAWLKEKEIKIFLEQPEFWTVRTQVKGKTTADFVLCKRGHPLFDGRGIKGAVPGTILDDLAHRDFTVNAMAMDEETGGVIDPYDGRKDLESSQLNCVGDTYDRFTEDPLRLIRAVRFHITQGFTLSSAILWSLRNDSLLEALTKEVSDDRKREELTKCFRHDTPRTLTFLASCPGIIQSCFENTGIWLMPTNRGR